MEKEIRKLFKTSDQLTHPLCSQSSNGRCKSSSRSVLFLWGHLSKSETSSHGANSSAGGIPRLGPHEHLSFSDFYCLSVWYLELRIVVLICVSLATREQMLFLRHSDPFPAHYLTFPWITQIHTAYFFLLRSFVLFFDYLYVYIIKIYIFWQYHLEFIKIADFWAYS